MIIAFAAVINLLFHVAAFKRHNTPLLKGSHHMGSLDIPPKNAKLQFLLGKLAFSGLPLSPEAIGRRKTILTEVVKGQIWTLDQLQGIINVNVPVRSTVVKLKSGGLFVNNPVAPTIECIDMLRSIEAEHGDVKYITLSSLALEHKGTCGPFAGYFPKATVYLQPGQYAFPLNLPSRFFFPLGTRIKDIPKNCNDAPWGDEIKHEVLGPLLPPIVGGFAETAFFHVATSTLLVTDTIIRVDDEPPAIVADDPRGLIYHARDDMFDIVEDSPANRRKGWRRMVMFALTFQPSGIKIMDLFEAIKVLNKVSPEMKKLGEGAIPFDGGFYPWQWVRSEIPNFRALQGGLLVAPILQKLLLNREPEIVLAWADRVSKYPIKRIIPCHFANDIKASSKDFREAFAFLEALKSSPIDPFFQALGLKKKVGPRVLVEDAKLLNDASSELTKSGIVFPPAPLVV